MRSRSKLIGVVPQSLDILYYYLPTLGGKCPQVGTSVSVNLAKPQKKNKRMNFLIGYHETRHDDSDPLSPK